MKKVQTPGMKFFVVFAILVGLTSGLTANNCSTKLFSVTIDSKLTIGDVIDNLADTCGLTVVVNDDAAKLRMNKKLYYVKLKNSTLKGFLNTILKDNDLNYSLNGNKLKISYLITRTFRIHYISGQRTGKSTANVTIASSSNSAAGGASGGAAGGGAGGSGSNISKTGMMIENTDEFQFWKTVETEVQRILVGAADGSTHYTKSGDTWTGPDGKIWEYNPLAPIVNPEAGMVTVTGTDRQINRVARYIHTLSKQIKSQVLIDVRILSVQFDDSSTTGVDWSQLYTLQNITVNSLGMAQKNIGSYTFDNAQGITDATFEEGSTPDKARVISATGSTKVTEIVKFLSTQGDVKSISSPRIMTLNNQPALISVGKELFYKIKSSSTASSGGGAVAAEGEMVDSVFAGILLDITPEIDDNGMITLKINPSISDTVDTVAPDAGIRTIPPDLVRRQIASVIKVKDGQHAILGGLISSQTGFKDNQVPLLGDMPLVGSLFKRQEKINKVEELVFILTPHIVSNAKSVSLDDLGYSKLNEK
ncbi:pilus (MSHA type) biogenesis protein MshL [Sulfurovum sp.]|uniref:pilus (MSHA type) biogenesis protein MshL n=1 Tax=Sulfurovum sp. TaxID=1969726 RepID=UPI0028680A8F|nr:pilus (MSHA type) biogenesis protein MshL [Sulfurovum sp.]